MLIKKGRTNIYIHIVYSSNITRQLENVLFFVNVFVRCVGSVFLRRRYILFFSNTSK